MLWIYIVFVKTFQNDQTLSTQTRVESLISRSVRLDYVDLTVKSLNPTRFPIEPKFAPDSDAETTDLGQGLSVNSQQKDNWFISLIYYLFDTL